MLPKRHGLPDFTCLAKAAGRGKRRPQVLIRLIKLLHGHPKAHPQQEFTRASISTLIGTTPGTLAVIMGPHYQFARERDRLLEQAGWKAVRRPLPAGSSKEWFVRIPAA